MFTSIKQPIFILTARQVGAYTSHQTSLLPLFSPTQFLANCWFSTWIIIPHNQYFWCSRICFTTTWHGGDIEVRSSTIQHFCTGAISWNISIIYVLLMILRHPLNSYSASHSNWCTATLWNRIMTAQCEGMGEVGSARYEPALLPHPRA